jgi:hypothetical protein
MGGLNLFYEVFISNSFMGVYKMVILQNCKPMKSLQLLKFFFISVPLACLLFTTAHIYFELKRLSTKWQKN